MTTVSLTLDVDVDLSEIDTEDLVGELERRRTAPNEVIDHSPALQAMFTALALGREEEALHLLRTYLCDCLGRVM